MSYRYAVGGWTFDEAQGSAAIVRSGYLMPLVASP
jgi:hypothetical protein